TSRLKPLDNKILKEYADVDYQDVISKELNKITHHSFVIPKDRIDEFDGIKIEDEAKNGSLEIDVYIDDENETCYMIDNSNSISIYKKFIVFNYINYTLGEKIIKK